MREKNQPKPTNQTNKKKTPQKPTKNLTTTHRQKEAKQTKPPQTSATSM